LKERERVGGEIENLRCGLLNAPDNKRRSAEAATASELYIQGYLQTPRRTGEYYRRIAAKHK